MKSPFVVPIPMLQSSRAFTIGEAGELRLMAVVLTALRRVLRETSDVRDCRNVACWGKVALRAEPQGGYSIIRYAVFQLARFSSLRG
jgi:hypothetical protein